jgi:glycosyltransferase involved in cell wall biosynthesis
MLSVVVCARDAAATLPRALRSVAGHADEVLVVDHESRDATAALARAAGVRVVQARGGAVGAARNAGVAAARGDLVAFLDADDEWLARRPDPRVEALEGDQRAALAFGLVEAAGASGPPGVLWGAGGVVIRREAFDRVGGFDAELATGEDLDWLLRARDAGLRSVVVRDVVYRYHRGPGGLTADPAAARRGLLRALRASALRARTASVSVVMPVLNGMPHLRESLASLAAQTHAPLEILVIDGGSTDGTLEECAAVGAVRVVDARGLSLSAAYNLGAEEARGDLVAFAADDDVCHPEKLERQLAVLRGGGDAALCEVECFLDGPAPPGFRTDLLDGSRVMRIAETLLVPRDTFWRVGGFGEAAAPAGDVDWYARASEAGIEFVVPDGVLLRKRMHAGSTAHDSPAMNGAILRTLRDSIQRRRAQ